MAALISGAFSAGCINPPPEAAARLAEVNEQGVQTERALDSIEDRLLGAHVNLALWQELARRHRSVSEVACQNLGEHAKEMVRNVERQQEKSRNLKRRIVQATSIGGGVATTSAKLKN
ncbi:MAG TPA: hypothetical protein VN918_07260 [Myxococcaceae bacterium]|nr:hypothetical protein [Myxococcaceae bacterium]